MAVSVCKCRGLGKEAWKNLISTTGYFQRTRSKSTAVTIKFSLDLKKYKYFRLGSRCFSRILVKGFSSSHSLTSANTDEYLSQLSERGLSFCQSSSPDEDYIGQPTYVTHPHLMQDGECMCYS